VRKTVLGLLACGAMAIASGIPAAHAAVTCKALPNWCPAQSDPGSDNGSNGVPEPGTIGLLAMGAAASIGMLRRRKR
jgi:hypothetical protein